MNCFLCYNKKRSDKMELNKIQKEFIDKKLEKLSKSKFRNSFYLKEKDKEYIKTKGIDTIEEHAKDFIHTRLSPEIITNDGKQTPMRGHPVFIAQHATATCCRGCLYKWHNIEKNKQLSEKEERFIVALIIEWINRKK